MQADTDPRFAEMLDDMNIVERAELRIILEKWLEQLNSYEASCPIFALRAHGPDRERRT